MRSDLGGRGDGAASGVQQRPRFCNGMGHGVRGPEALDMLKAWNTGHPGGITTLHANSAEAGLYRLEQLIQETVVTVPRDLIVQAIDIIVFIAGRGNARRIETLLELTGLDDDGNYQVTPIGRPTLHTI